MKISAISMWAILAVASFVVSAPFAVAEESDSTGGLTAMTRHGLTSDTRMYLVRRLYDFSKDIPAIRAANEEGHQAHLLKYGQTIISSALIGNDGTRIGSVSISDTADQQVINSYVYDDPFTKGGIYKAITIEPVDLYKVNGSYNRAPAWFAPELQRRQERDGFAVPVKPTGVEEQPAMYLVRRVYADAETVAQIRAEHDPAHNEHLTAYGRTIMSAALASDDQRAGGISISDYSEWDDISRYVYEDPFTRAGMFKEITIEKVDVYKLDGSYERAPAWFYDEMKRRQAETQ